MPTLEFDPEQPSTSQDPKIFSEKWYLMQHRESANLVDLLANRRIGGRRPRTPQCKLNRDIYTAVPLIRGSVVPEMIFRDHIVTWTPDGTRLICYSAQLDVVRIYFYKGVQSSRNVPEEQVLTSLLELEFEVKPSVSEGFQLRLDSLYFTGSGRFFVVGASAQVSEANVQFDIAYQNNESITTTGNLEDLSLICVDLETKQIVGEKYFHMDKIPLASCVNVSGNYLMIMSQQHQIIYIVQIHPQTGQMFLLKEIGPSVRDDDLLHMANNDRSNLTTSFYTGFRQRVMTFLYKRSKVTGTVRAFLRSTEYLINLRMDRSYLFEEFYIMVRMLPKDTNKETSANPCFFVIMDWRDARIVDIFEDYDERFLDWTLEMSLPLQYPVTTPVWVGASNFSYHAQWAMIRGIRKGEQKHCAESLRRLLNQMPFPSYQPYKISTQSPYLDPFLFQLDAKIATGIINGKLRADQDDPRFIAVRTGKASFQLSLSVVAGIGLRQVTLLFHPQDPLVLAVDRIRQDPSIVVFQPRIEVDLTDKSSSSGLPFMNERSWSGRSSGLPFLNEVSQTE